jgi:hypothetical protein
MCQRDLPFSKAQHTAISKANAGLLPTALERVFTERH